MDKVAWPPNYRLRRSTRSKHVNFHISPTHGLEIVVPVRFNLKKLEKILDEKRTWIEKHLSQHPITQPESVALPSTLSLNAIQQTWQVEYQYAVCKLQLIQRPDQTLVIIGPIEEKAACLKLLIRWLKRQATLFLVPCLTAMSQRMEMTYQSVAIRAQSTRWGSCSPTHRISLNAFLLFLPHVFMEYVIIHELCHTKHLNHSDRFWRLVEKHDPNFQAHRKGLKTAMEYIPKAFEF